MICKTTGKVSYGSRRYAKYARKQAQQLRTGSNARGSVRPYRCPDCDMWHLGHIPRQVVRTSRAEVFDGVKPTRPTLVPLAAPPAPPSVAVPAVVSAHVWFATRFCDEPRCAHEQPCPVHERRAA